MSRMEVVKPSLNYHTNSNEAITIIFIREIDELTGPKIKCKPAMTHQIFDGEYIFGYHNLNIDIYFAAHSGQVYIDYYYEDRVNAPQKFGLGPDDVLSAIEPWFPNNLMTDINEFSAHLQKKEPDYIYGECISCFNHLNEEGNITGFRVIDCDLTLVGFKEFHKRFQSLIIMYIDAANFIDLDDPNWRVVYLYEECEIYGEKQYCPVGFCTIYLFKSSVTVARISQFLIFPFLQKLRLGYKLLDATYNYLKANIPDLNEITVEQPSGVFTRMRDNLDISYVFYDSEFKKEKVLKGFSDQMLFRARCIYKFSNQQARKIYEILRVYYSQDNETAFNSCILDIKKHRYMKERTEKGKKKVPVSTNQIKESELGLVPTAHTLNGIPDLQNEVDKFIGSIQMTLKHIRDNYENED